MAETPILQAAHLNPVEQVHQMIHANHHPLRVREGLAGLMATPDLTTADLLSIAAMLMAHATSHISNRAEVSLALAGTISVFEVMRAELAVEEAGETANETATS
jgi:hypothetical protein